MYYSVVYWRGWDNSFHAICAGTLVENLSSDVADQIPLVADLRRQIASQQSVIEALQMNIADLTGHTARLERVEAGLPAIPSAALQPAKLPKFF